MRQFQILLVETQGGTLESLAPGIARARQDWQFVRVADAAAALELLAQRRVAVVLGSFGVDRGGCADFFRNVQSRQPHAIRVCLQPGEGPDASLDCVHQSIAARSGLKEIEDAIARSLSVWLRTQDNPGLATLLSRLDRIPTPPALYFTIRDEIESPACTAQRIAAIIGRDPALAARVLKVVNSGYYALPRTVADLQQAIALIGIDVVMALVLSAHLFDRLPLPGLNLDALWKHCFTVSELARHIARQRGGELPVVNACGVAGMLHDIGGLLLLANYPGQYQSIIRQAKGDETLLMALEYQQFGVSHPELGAIMLELWCLPDMVVQAVAQHHEAAPPDCLASEAVCLAELLVNEYVRRGGEVPGESECESVPAATSIQIGKWWSTCGQLVERTLA